MHQRTVIRNAIAAALTGATDAGARVFPTRTIDHLMPELPVIAVYALHEDSSLEIAPRELERHQDFMIESMVEADGDIDLAADNLAEQIETVMDTDYTFGLVCFESELTATDLEPVEDGDREIGILEMTYRVSYRTNAFVVVADDQEDYERTTAAIDLEGNQDVADQTNAAFEQEE